MTETIRQATDLETGALSRVWVLEGCHEIPEAFVNRELAEDHTEALGASKFWDRKGTDEWTTTMRGSILRLYRIPIQRQSPE